MFIMLLLLLLFISSGVLIIRCDNAYNVITINAMMRDFEMLLLLIRRRCSSFYNAAITVVTTVAYVMFIMR